MRQLVYSAWIGLDLHLQAQAEVGILSGEVHSSKLILKLIVGTRKCWGWRIEDRHWPIWKLQTISQRRHLKASLLKCDTNIISSKLARRTLVHLEIRDCNGCYATTKTLDGNFVISGQVST